MNFTVTEGKFWSSKLRHQSKLVNIQMLGKVNEHYSGGNILLYLMTSQPVKFFNKMGRNGCIAEEFQWKTEIC